jgi:hypothetical protein
VVIARESGNAAIINSPGTGDAGSALLSLAPFNDEHAAYDRDRSRALHACQDDESRVQRLQKFYVGAVCDRAYSVTSVLELEAPENRV